MLCLTVSFPCCNMYEFVFFPLSITKKKLNGASNLLWSMITIVDKKISPLEIFHFWNPMQGVLLRNLISIHGTTILATKKCEYSCHPVSCHDSDSVRANFQVYGSRYCASYNGVLNTLVLLGCMAKLHGGSEFVPIRGCPNLALAQD